MSNPRRTRGQKGKGAGQSPEPPWLWAWVSFLLVVLLWVTSMVNSYMAKVPGFAEAVAWLTRFAGAYLGFYSFFVGLVGMLLASIFSRVPDLSLGGLKVSNPLRTALSNPERLAFEEERGNWEQERKRCAREADFARQLAQEHAALQARLQRLETELETAAATTQIYDFAMNYCRHQDSVLERLFVAFHTADADFDLIYRQTMDWLAHLAKQLVFVQDRSLTCTIMAYDEAEDRCTVVGEVGAKAQNRKRFQPRRGIGVAGRVLVTGQPRVVPDVYRDPDYVPSTDNDPRSLISVPVFSRRRVVGLVNIRSHPAGCLGENDLKTIQFAVDQVGLAMEIRRLRDQTRKEALLRKRLNQFLTPEPEGGEPQ